MPSLMEVFSFEEALARLKKGRSFARLGWNGKNMSVRLITDSVTSEGDKIEPYFIIQDFDKGTINTWVPSVSDLLATDWF